MKTYVICLLFVFAATSACAQTDSRETIYWPVTDFVPWIILDGPDRGTGIADQIRQSIWKRMPQFRHELATASITRGLDEIRTKSNACGLPLLKTPEREATIEFSKPLFKELMPTNGVITTRNRRELFLPYLNEQDELHFDQFLRAGKYRIAIIPGRSYGNVIDPILKAHPNAVATITSKDNFFTRFTKLVNQDEFDGVLGYAMELRYGTRQLGYDEKDLAFVPIAGSVPQTIHVACSRSAAGTRIISQIDKIIEDASFQREVMIALRTWLPEEIGVHAVAPDKPAQSAR